ncbi:MAG: hypothetical protein K2X03_15780 [Bryobacteraceae bacterium]|nr:hypothetical protein [Bryobacteraceae bacterium]
MKPLYLLLLLTSLLVPMLSGQAAKLCNVSFRVLNVDGSPAPYSVTAFRSETQEFADRFVGLRGLVPCSVFLYRYQLKRATANARLAEVSKLEGTISANSPESWLTVSTDPGLVISPDESGWGWPTLGKPPEFEVWKGRLTQMPEGDLWIYFRSAVRSESAPSEREAQVDANGEFRVYRAFFKGPYILYVMTRDGRILHSTSIVFENNWPREPLEIAIPADRPAPIIVR